MHLHSSSNYLNRPTLIKDTQFLLLLNLFILPLTKSET